jgi:hypothetical protein
VTVWPDPAPEPETERGEDTETHLLPNRERLARMTRAERRELADLVREWTGPVVQRWRRMVAELEGDDNGA